MLRAVCYKKSPKVKVMCGSVPPSSYLSPLKYELAAAGLMHRSGAERQAGSV